MPLLVRAITYAILFVSLVLVFLPARFLSWSGIVQPKTIGLAQVGGLIVTASGALLALLCVLAFVRVGKGTPAPFDPPRRLVALGPYRIVRNPMYLGAGIALVGVALFYRSLQLVAYTGLLLLFAHLIVVFYEEPRLRRNFGQEYISYCQTVGRWLPKL